MSAAQVQVRIAKNSFRNPAMSAPTENQRAVRTLYCSLMFEARHRIDFLLRLCGDDYKLPDQPAYELGYLQLRLICETIALACLAVHGDVPFYPQPRDL